MNSKSPIASSPSTARLFRRHRLRAFMITALATYLLACLAYSTMIRGFSTESQVGVTVQNEEQFEARIRALLDQQLSDETLATTIQKISENTELRSPLLAQQDLERIKASLGFKVEKHIERPEYRIRAILHGHGTEDELILVNVLTNNIREQLSQQWTLAERQREIDDQFHQMFTELDRFSHDHERGLEISRNLISGIDQGLGDVYQAVVEIQREAPASTPVAAERQPDAAAQALLAARAELVAERAKLMASLNEQHPRIVQLDRAIGRLDGEIHATTKSDAPFRSVAHENAVSARVRDVLMRLEQMDVQPLLEQMATLTDSVESHAIGQRENLATLQALLQTRIDNIYSVDSEVHLSNVPIGGVPNGRGLIAILTLSCLLGIFIAKRYQPDRQNRGFASSADVSQKLGLPVVATLSQSQLRLSNEEPVPLANRLVRYAEIALFSVSLLLVSACLFHPEIRQAFFDNPFYGLARLSWIFVGGP